MTRTIAVASGKGGVGKTTAAANLAVCLEQLGHRVLVVDGNVTGANLSQHFGVRTGATLEQVVDGEASIPRAITRHPSGVSLLPSDIGSFEDENRAIGHLLPAVADGYDIVLVDGAPGTGQEASRLLRGVDEAVLVTEADPTARANAEGAATLAERYGTELAGTIVNRVQWDSAEAHPATVADRLGTELLGVVPYQDTVRQAVARGVPIREDRPSSLAARSFDEAAHRLVDEEFADRWYRIRKRLARRSPL